MKRVISSKAAALIKLSSFTFSVSLLTATYSTAEENKIVTLSIKSDQAEENSLVFAQRPRPPQSRRTQSPNNSELTRLMDGSVVNTQQLVALGNSLFHDANLSNPVGQSCASCHDINTGFAEPNNANPSSIGADQQSFGIRNAPTISYSALIPPQRLVQTRRGRQRLIGGLFMDGRAESLEEQAKMPFLNPSEMGNSSEQEVIAKIAGSIYASDFELLFGEGILLNTEQAYNYVADAIAAFERSTVFSSFSSKFDQVQAGTASFTDEESRGFNVFSTKGQCQVCHSGNRNVFSNFTYVNIGVPNNPQLPAIINNTSFVDIGLGAVTNDPQNDGQLRVPTLRNIANTSPYMHNGIFSTLREVIAFYNTRDTTFSFPPEVNRNIAQGGRLGELNLTNSEIDDLVAFLETLSDQ